MAMLANSLIVWSEVWKRKDNPKTQPLEVLATQRSANECRSYPKRQGSGSEHDGRMCCEGL
jgi:hypothetical protein